MPDEYTPDTAEIRSCYEPHAGGTRTEEHAEFDRWLVQYTAYVVRCAAQYAPETIDGAGQWAWLLEFAKDIEEKNGLKPWMSTHRR